MREPRSRARVGRDLPKVTETWEENGHRAQASCLPAQSMKPGSELPCWPFRGYQDPGGGGGLAIPGSASVCLGWDHQKPLFKDGAGVGVGY